MNLLDFNRDETEASDVEALSAAFRLSGIPALDALWRKPATTFKDRERTAKELFEVAVNGKNSQLRLPLRKLVSMLPLSQAAHQKFDTARTLHGENAEWAELVHALIIRLPFAFRCYLGVDLGQARLVIHQCLKRLLFANHVKGLDYESFLAGRMDNFIDVLMWFSRHAPDAVTDVGLSVSPVNSYLYDRRSKGLEGPIRSKVLQLYRQLDQTLDVFGHVNGSWFTLHQYCRETLGEPKSESRLFRLASDGLALTAAFKQRLSAKVGPEFAEALLSPDYLALWKLVKDLQPAQRADAFLRLTKARQMQHAAIGMNGNNAYEVLHKGLQEHRAWRELYDVARSLIEAGFDATDDQMAQMVNTVAAYGAVESELIVDRAFACCVTGEYPLTLAALRGLTAAGQATNPMNFAEIAENVDLRLKTFAHRT